MIATSAIPKNFRRCSSRSSNRTITKKERPPKSTASKNSPSLYDSFSTGGPEIKASGNEPLISASTSAIATERCCSIADDGRNCMYRKVFFLIAGDQLA